MPDQILTFDEAHARQLARLDRAYAAVRELFGDPLFNNELHGPYKAAVAEYNAAVSTLIRLASARAEAQR